MLNTERAPMNNIGNRLLHHIMKTGIIANLRVPTHYTYIMSRTISQERGGR